MNTRYSKENKNINNTKEGSVNTSIIELTICNVVIFGVTIFVNDLSEMYLIISLELYIIATSKVNIINLISSSLLLLRDPVVTFLTTI